MSRFFTLILLTSLFPLRTFALIGGTPTRSPYEVYFGRCTGTMIAPHLILTAAHCVMRDGKLLLEPGSRLYVRGYNGTDFARGLVLYQTAIENLAISASWLIHDSSLPLNNQTTVADVAVLALAHRLPFATATLPNGPRLTTAPDENQTLTVYGAGCEVRDRELTAGRLKAARLRIENTTPNELVIGIRDTRTGEDAGLCKVDSGGGAFNDSGELVAVNSWIGETPETADVDAIRPDPVKGHLARLDRGEILEWLLRVKRFPPPPRLAVNTEPQSLAEALTELFGSDRSEDPSVLFVIPYLKRDPNFACLSEDQLSRLARSIRRGDGGSIEGVLATSTGCR